MNVVIGGGSGIGAATAALLGGETLVADLTGCAAHCDLSDPASLAALADRVERLDALVVTAGVSPSQATARQILDIDLVGMATALEAFDHLVGPTTVAVCVASMAGHLHTPDEAQLAVLDHPQDRDAVCSLTDDPSMAYVLAKHGVLRLVRRLAASWGRRGARIVSVSPGVIDTPMGAREMASGNGADAMATGCAIGRAGHAEEVAAAIVWLVSSAASYVTGTDLLVDGGTVASFGL